MRLRFSRLALVAGGLLASAGLAAAQPSPFGPPGFPPAFPRVRAASTDGMVAAPGSGGVAQAGCSTCSPTDTLTSVPHYSLRNSLGHGGLGHGKYAIGEGCASQPGCSSYAAERTFFWGGCHQFFNPGNKCGSCGPLGGGLFGKHDIYPPGPGGLTNPNPCVYGSYLNR